MRNVDEYLNGFLKDIYVCFVKSCAHDAGMPTSTDTTVLVLEYHAKYSNTDWALQNTDFQRLNNSTFYINFHVRIIF